MRYRSAIPVPLGSRHLLLTALQFVMKLTDVHVDGFGVWSGLELGDLSPNCTVFYGANEAGKTTLLQFLRAALYGFSPARRSRYLPPLRGGMASGTLSAVDRADGRIRIVRREHSDQPLGNVIIEAADGTTQTNVELRRLLHDVDEGTFNNVFAVGLREMQELGTLTDTDAAQWLYSLTAGLDRVSLSEVLGELEASRSRLIAADGMRCELADLLAERECLSRELAQLSILPQQHAQLLAERDGCDAAIADAERETATHEAEHRVIEAAAVVFEVCQRRTVLNTQIAAVTPPDQWPAGSLQRMNRLTDSIGHQRRQVQKLSARRKQLAAEAAKIAVNQSLCRLAPRVAALAEHEAWILSIEQESNEAQSAVEQWTGEQQSQQGRLKSSAVDSFLATTQLDERGWAMLRTLGGNLAQARRRARATHQKRTQQRGDADVAQKKLASALGSRGQRDLTAAIEAAGNRVTQLRRRVQLDERIEQLGSAKADLEQEIAHLLERQIMPAWMVWAVGGLFVLGVVLILGGWFFASWGWTMIILGLLAIASAIGTKVSTQRSVAGQLDEAQNQLRLAESQLEDDSTEQEELDRALPKQGGNWSAQLAAAERDLSQLEQLLPLDSQQKSAVQSAGDADELADKAKRRWRKALRRWRAGLAAQGLSIELKPRQVHEMSIAGSQLRGVEGRLKDARGDLDRRRRELAGLAAQLEQVFLAAGIKPTSETVSQRLKQLRSELAEHENRRQRCDAVARLRRKLRRRQAAIRQRIERLQRRRRLLLRDCQVIDVAAFRRRAEESSKLAALIAERDAASREIASLLAGVTTEEAAEALIAGKASAEVEAQLAAAAARLAEARDRHRQLCERRGELTEQLRQLASDRRPAIKRFELNQVEQRLTAAVERWQVLTITHGVLLSIKEDYERNRQPETLREASEYLAELTRGHYRRVWTRFGESTLLVDDAAGKSLAVDVLSRGTREQLFLSLRLALVSLFARRGIELPMILDDVLVNFDADRVAAAVRVLRRFAECGHQLLVFTCHEHIARMFKMQQVDVRRLPDHSVGGRDLPFELEEPAPRKSRPRRIKEEPPPEPKDPPVALEVGSLNVVAAEPGILDEHFIVTAEASPGQVEVRLVEPPEPLPEVHAAAALPFWSVSPIRAARRRVDPPHRTARWASVRRGWNAEEFAGELDDQVNPRWLQADDLIEPDEQPEEPPQPEATATPPMRIIHPRFGLRTFKLLTDDEDDDAAPIIVELPEENFEADDKLA